LLLVKGGVSLRFEHHDSVSRPLGKGNQQVDVLNVQGNAAPRGLVSPEPESGKAVSGVAGSNPEARMSDACSHVR
jgi:hypothetical protein